MRAYSLAKSIETGEQMSAKSLESIHRVKTGKVSDKWQSYLGYYDGLFGPLRQAPVTLFEIGVQNGGSLETWAEYFENGKQFIGCDINPKCGTLRFQDSRIQVIVADATALSVRQSVQNMAPELDIVIDDGSHKSIDVISAFLGYFPLIRPGGLFVVEDAHTLYMDEYGGGILNEYAAYHFFKKLVDVVSFQFWRNELSLQTLLSTFFPAGALPQFIVDGWIESIEFRNSILTIRKALNPGHEKLGERLISGTDAQVWPGPYPHPVAQAGNQQSD